ncbi:MAG: pilus assembly FimT family protein [Actinomycetota bacterium]
MNRCESTSSPQSSLRGDAGFTLIELLVVIVIIGLISAMSMTALLAYSKSSAHRGAARETVALLRNAQVKAVTEARTWECRFTATRLEIWGPAGLARTYNLPGGLAFVTTPPHGFVASAAPGTCDFFAKGTATSGSVGVKRLDNNAERGVFINALTSRVSYCADPTLANPCTSP